MGDYLEVNNGSKAQSEMEPWEVELAKKIKGDNNHAERPFAVIKSLAKHFPSMSLGNLAKLSQARCNGTFCAAKTGGKTKKTANHELEAGPAMAADPALRNSVSKLCSVKARSTGIVTKMVRGHLRSDIAAGVLHRKFQMERMEKKKLDMARNRAPKLDSYQDTELSTLDGMLLRVESLKGQKGNTIKYLKGQFNARVYGKKWGYDSLGCEFRGKSGKLILKPAEGMDQIEYLKTMLAAMITVDVELERAGNDTVVAKPAMRSLPSISNVHTCKASIDYKFELAAKCQELAEPRGRTPIF